MDKIKVEEMLLKKGTDVLSDSAKIRDAYSKAKMRAREIPQDKEDGRKAITDLQAMLSLVQDYLRGGYKNISKHSLAILIGTIAYCASPLDLIPDPIPALGLSDDIALIIFAASYLVADIITYQNWKTEQSTDGSKLNEYLDATVGPDPEARRKEIDRLAGKYDAVFPKEAVNQEGASIISEQ